MVSLHGRRPPATRYVAGLLVFVQIYLGFVATLYHTHGTVPFAPMPRVVSSVLHPGAQPALAVAQHDCAICTFQASLVSPALTIDAPALLPQERQLVSTPLTTADRLPHPALSGSRAPPTA